MSKFVCKCGYVISDVDYRSQANSIVFTQKDWWAFIAESGKKLAELKQADASGKRQEWINAQFGNDYPRDASDAEVIEDLMSLYSRSLSVLMIRCESCGRIYIQTNPDSNDYTAFIEEASEPQASSD